MMIESQTKVDKRKLVRGIIGALLLIIFVMSLGLTYLSPETGPFFSKINPAIYGLGAVSLLYLTAAIVKGSVNPLRIVLGKDERPSTSQFQFYLWTIVVAFGYAAYFSARIEHYWLAHLPDPNYLSLANDFPQNVLIAMGFSATTLAGAKGITVGYLNSGSITKTSGPTGGLVSNDDGEPDLTKIQLLFWTLLGSVLFLYQVGNADLSCVPDATKHCLPDISGAVMALMGLGHGAYLGNKLASTDPIGGPAPDPQGQVHDVVTPQVAPSSLPLEKQYGNWLCWAASARMIGQAVLGHDVATQCQLASRNAKYAAFPPVTPTAGCTDGSGKCSCPVPGSCDYVLAMANLKDVYESLGIIATQNDPPASADELEIMPSQPLEVEFNWKGGGGHVAVITYYDQAGKWFQVNDPHYGIVYVDFNELSQAYSWGWLDSYLTFTKATSP